MDTSDLILTQIDTESTYETLMRNAVEYAILSIPFTFDRMGIRDLNRKILNIAKGKFAENMFDFFLNSEGVAIDRQITTTPFYQSDNRDFIFNNFEWDIKNNYLSHDGDFLDLDEYLNLPALVPNRGEWDQWGKRKKIFFSSSYGTAYVFTFMKKGNKAERNDFFEIKYTFQQELFIRELYETYQGKHQLNSPYEESWFWNLFQDKGGNFSINFRSKPQMVITGLALEDDFAKFKHYKPSQISNPYIQTIIPNMGVKVQELKSFKSYLKQHV